MDDAVVVGVSIVAAQSRNVCDNLAGESFELCSYWKLIDESTANEIEEESLIIDGEQFRGSTAQEDEAGNVLGRKGKNIQIFNSTTHLLSK